MRNGSLSSRTEPFFLHQLEPGVAAPQSLPSVNCSYGNLSIEQTIPVELLQGPPPHPLLTTNQVTLNWKVKGQVVVPKVGSTRPWIQVLADQCFILDIHELFTFRLHMASCPSTYFPILTLDVFVLSSGTVLPGREALG